MAVFTVGARLHDYGKGTPDELFGKVSADGFACVQLAYKKCVPGVASYADVTPQLVQDTLEAQAARRHHPRASPIYALQKPGNHSAGSRAPWRDRCH